MTRPYDLSQEAVNDLREVARYTLKTWGKDALDRYRGGLNGVFLSIGGNKTIGTLFSKNFPDLHVTKYKYHYIFYTSHPSKKPVIIGVIHERRDIVNRLTGRLS